MAQSQQNAVVYVRLYGWYKQVASNLAGCVDSNEQVNKL